LNLKFFYNISSIMKENNIFINYYYNPESIKNAGELQKYTDSNTMLVKPYSEAPKNAIELWMRNEIDGINFVNFTKYYSLFYSNILRQIGLEGMGIDTSLFQKEDYLLTIYDSLDDKYKDIDILIINSEPKSGQFNYNKEAFDSLIKKLSESHRVVTTSPVNDSIPCTMDNGLTLQDIGAVSTHSKYILGIATGPMIPCFNLHTKNYVKKWIILDRTQYIFEGLNYSVQPNLPDINSIKTEFSVE